MQNAIDYEKLAIALELERDALMRETSDLEHLETKLAPEVARHRSALIAGKAAAMAAAAGCMARIDAARARRSEITARLPQLETELETARAAQTEARRLDSLRELANESSSALADLEASRARLNEVLGEITPQLKTSRAALSGHRARFLELVGEISPLVLAMDGPNTSPEHWDAAQPELDKLLTQFGEIEKQGADLTALRSHFGRVEPLRSFDNPRDLAPLEFAELIARIEGRSPF